MNYRVFRYLVIGSIVSLLAAFTLFLVVLLSGRLGVLGGLDSTGGENRKITLQLKQIVQQIADNQDKLIAGSQQISKLLNIPPKQYNQLDKTLAWQNLVPLNSPDAMEPGLGAEEANDVQTSEKGGNSLEIAFYDALSYLDQNLQQEQAWDQLNQLLESQSWRDLLKAEKLRLERSEDVVLLFPDDEILPKGQIAPKWFELRALPVAIARPSVGPDGTTAANSHAVQLKLTASMSQDNYSGNIQLSPELAAFIQERSEQFYSLASQYYQMYQFVSSAAVKKQLEAKSLYIKSLQPARIEKVSTTGKRMLDVAQTDWEVRTRDEQVVARLYFDIGNYQLLWNDKSYKSLQLLISDWNIFVANIDTRTEGQRQEDEMRKYLLKMLADSAFRLQMKQYGLEPAALPPRQDDYYEYYDLLNSQGERVASFGLQKRVGEAYLMDRDDVKIRGLKSFLKGIDDLRSLFGSQTELNNTDKSNQAAKPKVTSNSAYYPSSAKDLLGRSSQGSRQPTSLGSSAGTWSDRNQGNDHDTEVILLVGTHDNMADVIMLISINKKTQTMTMISVPRDLYYNEMKINSIYSTYGPSQFMEILNQLTELQITKYISIDMYAFIEMVDLIGGIDVFLKEDLIDPTYKIKQMGRWETLVMRKGQHHLDGLGALRYVRSRHTSNDFERSERQQLILNQVAEKLRQQLSNPKKLLPFLRVVQKYLKTNFSSTDIAHYWLAYGAYQRHFGNTISTNNILYYTFTNYLGMSPEQLTAARQDADFYRGSFILLPRNGDWGLIRKYIMHLQEY